MESGNSARSSFSPGFRPIGLHPGYLLKTLTTSPGRVYSRDRLMDALYDDGRSVTDRTVDTHVKNLRRKLEAAAPGHDPIRSVYGAGYSYEPAEPEHP